MGMTVKHMNTQAVNRYKEEFDVYIGRDARIGDPKWGNPFKNPLEPIHEKLEKYEQYIRDNMWDQLDELKDKRLGCTCKPKPCHGDILVKLVNEKFGIKTEKETEFWNYE
jgi:hypothetical protein